MAAFYKSGLLNCETYEEFREIIGGMWYRLNRYEEEGYYDVSEYAKVFKGFDYNVYYSSFGECHFLRDVCTQEIVDFTQPKFDTKTKTVTFFESEEKRIKGVRSNPTKMGKFFRKIAPYFNDKQIEFLVNYMVDYFNDSDYTHHVAKGDKIAEIYTSKAESGRNIGDYSCLNASCMRHDGWEIHPTEVYATNSWELHYLTNENGDIGARALVCRDDDAYSYIYASCKHAGNTLKEKLKDLGFIAFEEVHRAFEGAKLLKIESNGGLVAPYIDHHADVKDCGDYLEITYGCSDYLFCSSGGYVEYTICRKCECCGVEYDEDEMITIDGEMYCDDCVFFCDHYNEYMVGDPTFVYYSVYRHYDVCEDALEDMGAVYNDEEGEWQTAEWYAERTKEDEEETEDENEPKKEIEVGAKCVVIGGYDTFHWFPIGTAVEVTEKVIGGWDCLSKEMSLRQIIEEKDLVIVE